MWRGVLGGVCETMSWDMWEVLGGKMKEICDLCFIVPSSKTALIQELHTMLGHEICKRVEKEIVFNE